MSSTALALQAGRRIGRFVLVAELGRGAQAVVWRAHDERLDRDVAIKLMTAGADRLPGERWLDEARAVGRLSHPNIVPLFEVIEGPDQPALIFELVEGETLAARLRRDGAMPAREAVLAMLGILDALRLAHAHGIVHRDLKPSNILIDADGRPRVMDFGIAARLIDGHDGRIVGSAGYMSPEAARGESATAAMDVFTAGMVLAEMLSGQRVLLERDPLRALQRTQNEDMRIPDGTGVALDDRLRSIVQRALVRQVADRTDSAQAMHDALLAWLQPTVQAAGTVEPQGHGTLDFLLRKMRHKTDFPALSQSVMRIQRMAASDSESLNTLAEEILKDVALSNKLLRLVNTAHFRGASQTPISTVSRAVALMGFAGIRNMALSLMLIEHMQDKAHASRLSHEFLRALTAGQMASELASQSNESEEAFLGAMLYNLGRLLTEYYLPEEAEVIRGLAQVDGRKPDGGKAAGLSREQAAARVLGIGFESLGLGVARSWSLPDSLQRCMLRGGQAAPARAVSTGLERLRWLTHAANAAADAVLACDAEALTDHLRGVANQYGRALGLDLSDFCAAALATRARMLEMAPALGLRWADWPAATPLPPSAPPPGAEAPFAQTLQASMAWAQADASAHEPPKASVADQLAAGIQDITNTLAADSFDLNSVLRMVLETLHRALGLQRVVLCLRDARGSALVGCMGLGDNAQMLCPQLRIALKSVADHPPDLFAALCAKGSDMLVQDSGNAAVARRLPDGHAAAFAARALLLLPMTIKGAPIGMIYADKAEANTLTLGERELSLVRTLRNQAVMALRQAT